MEILTPENPRWDEFADALITATRIADDAESWLCDGDRGEHRYRYAKAVMAKMGDVDIEKSIEFLASRGGYCDCEILFNVDPH